MSEVQMPDYHVEELSEAEQAALVAETDEHHQEPSCQSDAVSDGESDLSMRKEEATE